MTDTDIDRIVAGMTEAERRCLLWACSFLPCSAPVEGQGVEQFCDDAEPVDTINKCFNAGVLVQLGCGDFDDFRIVVTPLGQAVRARLEAEHAD